MEDTDAALKTEAYVDAITAPLRWLGLDWDGDAVFQSQRRDAHLGAVEALLADGRAYFCDMTRPEIEARCAAEGRPVGYHGWSRRRDVSDGPGVVVRFACPDDGATTVDDVVRGRVSFSNESLEDFVIRRGDGSPTFHVANAVDDHDMGITHVIRGEDLLNTTPRVLLLWEALGYGAAPSYAHLPLLVNAKRQKLSKRRDDVSLDAYRSRGYLPEAMVNHLALLGWGPPDEVEIRPLAEMVDLFDLEAVKAAPAFFDPARLDHINAAYIKALTPEQFADSALPHVCGTRSGEAAGAGDDVAGSLGAPSVTDEGADHDGTVGEPADRGRDTAEAAGEARAREVLVRLAGDLQQRVSTLGDTAAWIEWILAAEVVYDEKAWTKAMVKGRAAALVLEGVEARLADDDFSSAERLEAIVMGVGDELSESAGARVRSQAPVRVALSGTGAGRAGGGPARRGGRAPVMPPLRAARARL